MKTIDIHTHLLNPNVSFNRPLDRFVLRFFAKRLGADYQRLREDPFNGYVEAMASAIRHSSSVDKTCLFGVDSRVDSKGQELHRDITVCASTEDVLSVSTRHPAQFIPFMSVNPRRPDALDLIDEYVERGCQGSKFLQNYWGVDLNNPTFIPYYEKLREQNIPVIIHIGPEYTIHS
ncbi:MAG: amidohydrolase family protein [Candidatus Thiodiazotropha sp. (ex Monitilora ramsayi)]|nr:amidohydrolase family protein [Candidatus Thiodiazotropha sp. (ex Monitilora ramsayi)]